MSPHREETWYRLSAEDTFDKLGVSPQGLCQQQAQSRLQEYGRPNTIRSDQ